MEMQIDNITRKLIKQTILQKKPQIDSKEYHKHIYNSEKKKYQIFRVLKFIEIVIYRVYYTIPCGFTLFRHFLTSHLIFKLLCLAKDH